MKDSKDIAEWVLREIAGVNPYTSQDKTLAFIWATGFLARCVAEMIWRDNQNYKIFAAIRERAARKLGKAPLQNTD